MNRYHPVFAGLIITLAMMLGGVSCLAEPAVRVEQTRSLMGTFVTVTVYADDEAGGNQAINASFVRMEEIEKIASIYDEQSQASRLNRRLSGLTHTGVPGADDPVSRLQPANGWAF